MFQSTTDHTCDGGPIRLQWREISNSQRFTVALLYHDMSGYTDPIVLGLSTVSSTVICYKAAAWGSDRTTCLSYNIGVSSLYHLDLGKCVQDVSTIIKSK